MSKTSFTGKQRLAIFFSLIWMSLIGFVAGSDPEFKWVFFLLIGVFPVALIWGVVWVVVGFRQKKE